MSLPIEERILRLGHRVDQLKAGAGDYDAANRAHAIKTATNALDHALAELRVSMTWGPHVIH